MLANGTLYLSTGKDYLKTLEISKGTIEKRCTQKIKLKKYHCDCKIN